MSARFTFAVLVVLLVFLQGQLWLGHGGVARVHALQSKRAKVHSENEQLAQIVLQTQIEVDDLHKGGPLLEGMARQELGMIKRGEVLVEFK